MIQPNRRSFLAAVTLAAARRSAAQDKAVETSICVYGATGAGVVAAVQASRMGERVLLVEPRRHVGGMNAEGLGATDVDNHPEFQNSLAVGGLAREFYRRIAARYGRRDAFDRMIAGREKDHRLWKFEPRVAESVFEEWLDEAGVEVLRDHRLRESGGVVQAEGRIQALRFENGAEVRARVFLDCTYEGDLLAFAGLPFAVGREGNDLYGETKNGVRPRGVHKPIDRPIDPYVEPGDPASGLIHGVFDEEIGAHGAPSGAIQGFSFRTVFSKEPRNRIPFEKPVGYDPAHYEQQRRYFAAGGEIVPQRGSLPNSKTEPGCWHILCGFLTGWNHGWNTASYAERDRLLQESLEYVQGLYWFLAGASEVPEGLRRHWSEWGLCKDEFQDNRGWPRMFYPRNGRRMISDFVVTEAHGRLDKPEPIDDPVGLCWWPHDLHHARRLVKNGLVWNEGAVFNEKQDWRPHGISYRSLTPKASQCVNLITPTCPSMSYVAYGAFRTEFSFMIAGQAAGTAAALAVQKRTAVQGVDYEELRQRLVADGQVLHPPGKA